jgi:hypothetical protein
MECARTDKLRRSFAAKDAAQDDKRWLTND